MRKFFGLAIVGAIMVGMVGLTNADFARPADAIAYRQAVMRVIGHHFGLIGAVVKGEKPFDPKDVAHHADIVAALSQLPWEAFLVPGTAEKSQMKEDALRKKEDFRAAAGETEQQAAKLARAAAGGNLGEIRSHFGGTAGSCKACHDVYRSR
jgi:cytochrome c556